MISKYLLHTLEVIDQVEAELFYGKYVSFTINRFPHIGVASRSKWAPHATSCHEGQFSGDGV